jgi:hypothetical protein
VGVGWELLGNSVHWDEVSEWIEWGENDGGEGGEDEQVVVDEVRRGRPAGGKGGTRITRIGDTDFTDFFGERAMIKDGKNGTRTAPGVHWRGRMKADKGRKMKKLFYFSSFCFKYPENQEGRSPPESQ